MAAEPLAAEPARERVSWRHRVEAWLAAIGFGLDAALPLDAASALGGAFCRWVGPRLGLTRRARNNLRAAFPELDDAAVERIVRGMWDNLGRVAAEFPHVRKFSVLGAGSRVETAGFEHIAAALEAGRSMILVSAHLGNWEVAALAIRDFGVDATYIYRAANNPLFDRFVVRFRGSTGDFVPKGTSGSRQAVAVLRRNSHLGLLADQKMNDGIAVPFFGRDAMTMAAPAALGLHFGCDILPVRVERLRGAHFRLTVHPPLALPDSGDRDADTRTVMTEINRLIESWVRERPEQWLWLHHRWPD